MDILSRIQFLAKKRRTSLRSVAADLSLGENYLYSLKSKRPNSDNLEKIADYFHTSTDFLLGRVEDPYSQADLREMAMHSMAYGGKPISDADREFIVNFLQAYFSAREKEGAKEDG